MRIRLLILVLAASAPAIAAADPIGEAQSRREAIRAGAGDREMAREQPVRQRPEEAAPAAGQRVRDGGREPRTPSMLPGQPFERRERTRIGDVPQEVENPGPRSLMPRRAERPDNLDSIRNWRREEREQLREARAGTRPGSRPSPVITPPRGARPDVQAPAPAQTARHRELRPWHRDKWREDRRYDWRRHRHHNRWLFNLGFYYDPFGWSYRRYPIGWRLWPSYYQYDHWLRDPWRYRLPPAYGPYRWVRYWDDALLVDIHSGRVVDVIHGFFW